MTDCRLSIHMIGNSRGIVPDGAEQSILELQNRVAARHSEGGELDRLIWIPPTVEIENEQQQEFIRLLRGDRAGLAGADWLETPLEELKSEIDKKLHPPAESDSPTSAVTADGLFVYLICDKRDVDNTPPLEDHLSDLGFEIVLPEFEGEVKEVRQIHEDTLRTCDAVLVYFGAANALWLRSKLREVSKIKGQGRDTDFMATCIFTAPPESEEKERYLNMVREGQVIRHYDAFAPAALAPFLSEIESAKGAAS